MEKKVKKHSNRKELSRCAYFYAGVISENIFYLHWSQICLKTNIEILCMRKNKINVCGQMNVNPQGLAVISKDKMDYLSIFGTTSRGPLIPTAK